MKSKPIISVLRLLVVGIAGTTFDFHFLETNLKHDIYTNEYNHIKSHFVLEIMIGYGYLTLLSSGFIEWKIYNDQKMCVINVKLCQNIDNKVTCAHIEPCSNLLVICYDIDGRGDVMIT